MGCASFLQFIYLLRNFFHYQEPWNHGFYKGAINERSKNGVKLQAIKSAPQRLCEQILMTY